MFFGRKILIHTVNGKSVGLGWNHKTGEPNAKFESDCPFSKLLYLSINTPNAKCHRLLLWFQLPTTKPSASFHFPEFSQSSSSRQQSPSPLPLLFHSSAYYGKFVLCVPVGQCQIEDDRVVLRAQLVVADWRVDEGGGAWWNGFGILKNEMDTECWHCISLHYYRLLCIRAVGECVRTRGTCLVCGGFVG